MPVLALITLAVLSAIYAYVVMWIGYKYPSVKISPILVTVGVMLCVGTLGVKYGTGFMIDAFIVFSIAGIFQYLVYEWRFK